MNSLNLISSRVIGQTPTAHRPRSHSQSDGLRSKLNEDLLRGRSYSEEQVQTLSEHDRPLGHQISNANGNDEPATPTSEGDDEKEPLLNELAKIEPRYSGLRYLIKKITDALTAILSTIGMPVVYVVKCFQDEDGHYSALVPFRRRKRRKAQRNGYLNTDSSAVVDGDLSEKPTNRKVHEAKLRYRRHSNESLTSATSDSESDQKRRKGTNHGKDSDGDEGRTRQHTTRIKLLHNDEAIEKRKRKSALSEQPLTADGEPLNVENIKSPISTSLHVTRYPQAPQPPRPLVPRRQPSYSNLVPRLPMRFPSHHQQKTLVLDLDETLIHSMAKGGRMSTGHMVEVKLNVPVALSPSQSGHQPPAVIGPQHPILYYVHKRPHCDEFLRKISKWFKLVIFTASVQEYADPVVDWLETERKYFHGRYYRQHCTFRNGSYIKDLSSIEPDLSKVMILDNSPISYIFHEDNAIPIEGWINDPTDNDLLHLVPLLEALQYVNDVRALLALRRGEAETA